MEDRKTTIRLPEDLHRRVKAKAAMQGRTITAVVREYLERWVKEGCAQYFLAQAIIPVTHSGEASAWK